MSAAGPLPGHEGRLGGQRSTCGIGLGRSRGSDKPRDEPRRGTQGGDIPHNILHHWREAVPHDRMAHLIRDTERAFRRALQIRLAEYKVPFGHWSFLRILWEADGLTQKELSSRAGVMEPTTFAAMKTMEALGYITRKQLSTNKKNVYVHLTAKGRALKKRLVPLAEETNHISVAKVNAADLATTRRVLLAMIENLAQDESARAEAPNDRLAGRVK